jgi:glycosyltransferase involved in cell wall biosynthesis
MKLPSFSVVFPAYNDAKTIRDLVVKANRVGRKVAHKYEIIVVNDGSTDDTKHVLTKLTRSVPLLRVIHHRTNQGYGAAIRSGFRAAGYTWVFYTDGDGQYDPAEMTKLAAAVNPHIDVVNGYKIERNDSPERRLIGDVYNGLVQLVYKPLIADVDCDFRLIRASLLRKTKLQTTSGRFPLELILELQRVGARFAQVPIHHYPRKHGTSEFFRPKHVITTIGEFFGVR